MSIRTIFLPALATKLVRRARISGAAVPIRHPAFAVRQTGGMSLSPRRGALVALVSLSLVASACANRAEPGADSVPATTNAPTATGAPVTTEAPTDTDAPAAESVTFGDLESPCGPSAEGVVNSVDPDEAKGSTDVIRLAASSDKGNVAVPGLNGELYDQAVAFAAWCNEQGGIAGVPVEILDADAKLFDVPAQMENICDNAFAMAGGGFAFDDQEFPRFHECGMIDIAGFTVTAGKSLSDNLISPMPNPSNAKDGGWFAWATAVYPEAMQSFGTVYSDILTSQVVEEQYVEIAETLGGTTVVERIPYNSLGEANWTPIAQQLKDAGVRAMAFVGVPEVLPKLTKAMDEIGYRPELIMADAGFYAEVLLEQGGSSVEGVVVRTAYALFEESAGVKSVADYLAMMDVHNPEGKVSGLGMQGLSAMLLFASAARDCFAEGEVLTRSCVMEKAAVYTNWTGGGLHGPSNPGTNRPSPCYQMIEVRDGGFTRLYPPLEPTDADRAIIPSTEITAEGWACDESTVVDLVGDYGDTEIGRIK